MITFPVYSYNLFHLILFLLFQKIVFDYIPNICFVGISRWKGYKIAIVITLIFLEKTISVASLQLFELLIENI